MWTREVVVLWTPVYFHLSVKVSGAYEQLILTWIRVDGAQEGLPLAGVERLHFSLYEGGLVVQNERRRGSEFLIVGGLAFAQTPSNK